MNTRICNTCRKEKTIKEFYLRRKDCKDCVKHSRKRLCICRYCKNNFYPEKQGKGRFCSDKCRLLFRVIKDEKTGCWNCKGANIKKYCSFSLGNKSGMLGHRIAYELFVGVIPERNYICHKCDNPPCVNPEHLFLGTAKDNSDDMILKGRQKHPGHPKITKQEIHKIFELRGTGKTHLEISKVFGVTRNAIGKILKEKGWKPKNRSSGHFNAKLREEDIKKIFELKEKKYSNSQIARLFDVNPITIWKIINKRKRGTYVV